MLAYRWRECAFRLGTARDRRAVAYLVRRRSCFVPMADLINRMKLGDSLSAVMLTYPTLLCPSAPGS